MHYDVKSGMIREDQQKKLLEDAATLVANINLDAHDTFIDSNGVTYKQIPFSNIPQIQEAITNIKDFVDAMSMYVVFRYPDDMVRFEQQVPNFYTINITRGGVKMILDKKAFKDNAGTLIENLRNITFVKALDHGRGTMNLVEV